MFELFMEYVFKSSVNFKNLSSVIPAKAGIQDNVLYVIGKYWIPAFAGMTITF